MTEFSEIIRTRRSIRNYEDRTVPEEVLNRVLETVKWSPSWANTQCWEIIVIKKMAMKTQLQEAMRNTNPAWKSLAAAPVVLALCGKLERAGYYQGNVTTKHGDWMLFDLGIAAQTLCLAAENEGLGTVITGLFDHDKAKEILKVPQGYEVVSLIPLGYPSKTPSAPKRREPAEYLHAETF
jgi:nitroreductase